MKRYFKPKRLLFGAFFLQCRLRFGHHGITQEPLNGSALETANGCVNQVRIAKFAGNQAELDAGTGVRIPLLEIAANLPDLAIGCRTSSTWEGFQAIWTFQAFERLARIPMAPQGSQHRKRSDGFEGTLAL
mgnify:CR=1 FL=1